MEMQKFKITDEFLNFGAGTILGLDTKQAHIFAPSIRELEDEEGVYKVQTNITLKKGMIVHAPPSQCKSLNAFFIGTPRKYREPDPVQVAKTKAHFEQLNKLNAAAPLHRRGETAESARRELDRT